MDKMSLLTTKHVPQLKAFLDDSGIPHESRPVNMLTGENYSDPDILKYREVITQN